MKKEVVNNYAYNNQRNILKVQNEKAPNADETAPGSFS